MLCLSLIANLFHMVTHTDAILTQTDVILTYDGAILSHYDVLLSICHFDSY